MEKDKAKKVFEWKFEPVSKKEQFLEEYNTCPLCGTDLIYSHVTNFLQGNVEEQAECPSCSVNLNKQLHSLQ